MSSDNAETGRTTDVVAAADKQVIEKRANDVPATPTVRPWTSDFLLPSIRFRESKGP